MRDFIKDLILEGMERTRGEISLGIQEALIPKIMNLFELAVIAACTVVLICLIFEGKNK